MKKCLVIAAFVALLIVPSSSTAQSVASPTTESITIDQAQPVTWGEPLSLTATYTSAEKKSNPPRIYNPTVAIECGSWRAASILFKGQKNVNIGGGWWEGDFLVGSPTGSGSASCTAWLEFTSSQGVTTILASTQFPID